MLGVMLQKLWHKKWMALCLFLGSTLLIATVSCFPMYRKAAFDRMLRDEFDQSLAQTGDWPAKLSMVIVSKRDAGGSTMSSMEEMIGQLYGDFGVKEKETVLYYSLLKADIESEMQRNDLKKSSLRLGFLSNLQDHVKMLAGTMYSEDGRAEDGSIEVVISQDCMIGTNLLVGETVQFTSLEDASGRPIRMKIVGVYERAGANDCYWQVTKEALSLVCLMNEQLFREMFTGENAGGYTLTCSYYALIDYEKIEAEQAEKLSEITDQFVTEGPYRNVVSRRPAYCSILDSFDKKQDRIEATLFILQIPELILLCAFLLMLSSQMYDMERNEISVLKSRGSSGRQIFRLYLYQSIFLTGLGCIAGLPLGMLFCRILGSARNFLEIGAMTNLTPRVDGDVLLYTAAAMLASVAIIAIPAIKHSRITIVNLKQQKAAPKRSFWEISFLDVICLVVSVYGYYSFSNDSSSLTERVLKGEPLDPLLYVSSSLFILGMGLLLLRLQPLLVKLVYKIGQNRWRAASYASFLENIKNGRRQQFIMIFMILTISMGMFHDAVARTIRQNALDNAEYLSGADVIVKEVWEDNSSMAQNGGGFEFAFYEPNYEKYDKLEGIAAHTKVILDTKGYVPGSGNSRLRVTVMGIHTKEFGEITYVEDGLQEKYYYEYLNTLAARADGVLVSKNLQVEKNYKEGDSITFYDSQGNKASGKIVGFFDFWPGYEPETMSIAADGSVAVTHNYMVVTHFAGLTAKWGIVPYEVWMSYAGGAGQRAVDMGKARHAVLTREFSEWLDKNNVRLTKYSDRYDILEGVIEDPLLQGTNGVLTMGFIVTILLCAVGYLIYWIMSIRSRELTFGVLRACGMHKGELFHLLVNEQLFSGVFSVFAGIGIGKAASRMFVPILQTAYAASNQVLPMQLVIDLSDMYRLYGVIAGVMIVCLVILAVLVVKLNVAKALKLGEE